MRVFGVRDCNVIDDVTDTFLGVSIGLLFIVLGLRANADDDGCSTVLAWRFTSFLCT